MYLCLWTNKDLMDAVSMSIFFIYAIFHFKKLDVHSVSAERFSLCFFLIFWCAISCAMFPRFESIMTLTTSATVLQLTFIFSTAERFVLINFSNLDNWCLLFRWNNEVSVIFLGTLWGSNTDWCPCSHIYAFVSYHKLSSCWFCLVDYIPSL